MSANPEPQTTHALAATQSKLPVASRRTPSRGGVARAARLPANNAAANTIQLDQLQGFAPLGAHTAPVRSPVGTLSRQFTANALSGINLAATFGNGVAGGWNVNDAVVPLGVTQGCP